MLSYYLKLLLNIFLFFFLSSNLYAQSTESNVVLDVENQMSSQKLRLLNLVVTVKNVQSQQFKGKLQFVCPKGFKNINGEDLQIILAANEIKYIPVKIVIDENADAGKSIILTKLYNQSGILISQKSTEHIIDVDSSLSINSLATTLYRSSPEDPISVKIRVSNTGNVQQDVIVVCKFPDPSDTNLFFEQNAVIPAKKDSVFTFTYLPSKNLARLSTFSVNISGFRNPDKEIFGSASVGVQNISSVQKYQNLDFFNFSDETKNQITTSYRKVGNDIDIYQITGSGGVNLSSGYVFLRGNIALLNNQQTPLVTNTNLILRQGRNEYSIGSVNKLLDMTLVGRGVEYSHTFQKNQKIEVGFVDQNFNLAEKNSWLKNGYGFFTKGTLQSNNNSKNISAAYIYRYDPFEKVNHSILGTEANYDFNEFWKLNAKLNGGISNYESQNSTKPSFSAESNYFGKFKNINLNGNYFFSSDYYPGNRRGSIYLQQSLSTQIKKHSLHTNFIVSNFSPKFYFFDREQLSQNTRLEIGNRFPKLRDFNLSILYQYQNESSNSYNNFFGNWNSPDVQKMKAHRIVEQFSWISTLRRQSLVVGIETGLVNYPMSTDSQFQMRLSGNYSFRKFNVNSIYQSGSYYLSEYAFTALIGEKNYKKMTYSFFYNDSFVKDKINLSTGLSYIDDVVYGKSPSAFMNAKYIGKNFNAFLNSSWYNYSSGALHTNLVTFEIGVTVNLRKTVLNPEKKAVIKAFAFYDDNGNNIYDNGEKPAVEYILNINTIALKTNNLGEASYRSVPFGKYMLKQFIQQGWYYDESEFVVDNYVYSLQIPLHQNGSFSGKVSFDYNIKKAVEFEHRGSSITCSIMKDDQVVQKIYTNDEGEFTAFLPTGDYTVVLNESSLPTNTFCEIKSHKITINAGKISTIPNFIISVKEKKINTKKFGN